MELAFTAPAGKLGLLFDDLPAGPQRQFGPFVCEVRGVCLRGQPERDRPRAARGDNAHAFNRAAHRDDRAMACRAVQRDRALVERSRDDRDDISASCEERREERREEERREER